MASSPKQPGLASEFDRSVPALVLNFGEYPYHQGSLGIIRSLGSVGIPVYAVQRNALIPSGGSRYLRGKFLWQTDGTIGSHFIERLANISKALGRPAILIPADDLSAILIAEHAEALAERFLFARPPTTVPRLVANKQSLYNLCQRLGIDCPSAEFPQSRTELLDAASHVRLPVVVKVAEPWLAPPDVRSTVIVAERGDLIDYCERFARWGSATTLIIQELIPADSSEDWFVHGYCDHHANPAAVFTGIKLRCYPAFAGPTTLARAVRNDTLRNRAIELLKAIDYQGIMDLDYKFDKRDGRYKLLDFNPRVGAQFRLFKSEDGLDVVRAMHLDLTGRPSPSGLQVEGRTFVAEIQDLLASCSYVRRGTLTLGDWWRSLRTINETAWYSADDPLPLVLMCLHLPFRAAWRRLGVAHLAIESLRSLPLPPENPTSALQLPPEACGQLKPPCE